MIIGCDLLTEPGIDFSFKNQILTWDTAEIPMKPRDCTPETAFHIKYSFAYSFAMDEASDRIKQIIDAKYDQPVLTQLCKNTNISLKKSKPLYIVYSPTMRVYSMEHLVNGMKNHMT